MTAPVGGLDGPGSVRRCWLKNSWNGRSPMKQMPVLSGLSNTGRPAACAMRAHLRLVQAADGKQRLGQGRDGDAVQEVALILGGIRRLQQVRIRPLTCRTLRVVAGGDPRGAQALHVFQTDAELDLSIAKHVRIRRAAGRIFAQEVG